MSKTISTLSREQWEHARKVIRDHYGVRHCSGVEAEKELAMLIRRAANGLGWDDSQHALAARLGCGADPIRIDSVTGEIRS